MRFGSIDAEGTEHTEEYFGVIHNAMEVFGARASCVEDYVIGGMAFLGFILRNVGRNEFSFAILRNAGRVGFGGSFGNLMVFDLVRGPAGSGSS